MTSYSSYVATLSPQDSLLFVAACALATHFVYKRWEPPNVYVHGFLILILPTFLSFFLVTKEIGIIRAFLSAFGVYYATLCSSIVLYRLSPFHPYYRYPGPIMAKMSKIWMAWVASHGKQHVYIRGLHDKYGDVVRIGPNEISIRDVTAINPLMGSHGLPKGPNWTGRTLYDPKPSTIAVRDSHAHMLLRKPWNRALNMNGIKNFQPMLSARVSQLVESIGSQKAEVDLAKWMGFFTYDFMGDMAFGGGTEMLRDGDSEHLWEQMEKTFGMTLWIDHLPWLGQFIAKFPSAAPQAVFALRRMAMKRVMEWQRGGATRKDLMYSLTNEDIGEQPPTTKSLVSEGILAIIAGSDTTSSVLSNAFFFLLTNPEVYGRLQAEVDKFYPAGEDSVNPEHYPKMSFLDAVINETLRLLPAVLSGSQRAPAVGSGGKAVGPYFIPEGNQARIHFYSVQRDPRNFTDPDTFWPNRWLIAEGALPLLNNGKGPFTHNLNAFVPFSHGPANCVGKPLAMLEMRMVLCHTMQRLTLRLADGWDSLEWERQIEDRFVTKHGALPIIAQWRA